MTKLELNTAPKTTSAGLWVKTRDGGYRCGNVKVKAEPDANGLQTWFVFVRQLGGRWVKRFPKQRPYGYVHHGAAKLGARLMELWQRR